MYMDSPSLTNRLPRSDSDANVYLAFWWRRYLLAHYVCALRLLKGSLGSKASFQCRFCQSRYLYLIRGFCLRDF